jgi:DNA-binding transcriptional regulator YdaS (Cro superfamily)
MTNPQLREAVRAFNDALMTALDGNLSELARRCGVSPQAVQSWTVSGAIPARRVVQVCNALNNKVNDWQLRPDIFRSPKKRGRSSV